MLKILKYSFFDLFRSRWSLSYFLFYFITTSVLFYLSPDPGRVIVSMMNILLILTSLIGTLYGVLHYYNSREFIELLLAQPVRRKSIFYGMVGGIMLSLVLALTLGLLLPFLLFGSPGSSSSLDFAVLTLSGVFLTVIFTSIGFTVALYNENRLVGFGAALLIWLFLAFIYDGLFLLSLLLFEAYPLEKFALVMALLNPIDLTRIMIILQVDISALLGYTGAVFNAFLGSGMGIFVALAALLIWCIVPQFLLYHKSLRKDF